MDYEFEVDRPRVAKMQRVNPLFNGLELDPMDDTAIAAYQSLGRAKDDPNCKDNPGYVTKKADHWAYYTLASPSIELSNLKRNVSIRTSSWGKVKGVRIVGEYLYALCQGGGIQMNVLRDVSYILSLSDPYLQVLGKTDNQGDKFIWIKCPLTLTLDEDQIHFLESLLDQHVGTDALQKELQALNPLVYDWMKANGITLNRDNSKRGCYFKGRKVPLIILLGCEWETSE